MISSLKKIKCLRYLQDLSKYQIQLIDLLLCSIHISYQTQWDLDFGHSRRPFERTESPEDNIPGEQNPCNFVSFCFNRGFVLLGFRPRTRFPISQWDIILLVLVNSITLHHLQYLLVIVSEWVVKTTIKQVIFIHLALVLGLFIVHLGPWFLVVSLLLSVQEFVLFH